MGVPVHRTRDIDAAQRCDGHRPREDVADLFFEVGWVAVAQGTGELADFFDEATKGRIDAARTITRAIRRVNLVLKFLEGHGTRHSFGIPPIPAAAGSTEGSEFCGDS